MGFRCTWISVLVIAATCGCSPPPGGSTNHPLYVRGLRLKEAGRFREAAEVLERCVRTAPGHVQAHAQLGILYEDQLDSPWRSLYHYRTALEILAREGKTSDFLERSADRALKQLATTASRNVETVVTVEQLDECRLRTAALERQRDRLLDELKSRAGEVARLQREMANLRNAAGTAENDTGAAAQVYTVRKGDTLSGIAREHYGSDTKWRQLRDYNRDVLKGDDLIRPGMKLHLPPPAELERMGGTDDN